MEEREQAGMGWGRGQGRGKGKGNGKGKERLGTCKSRRIHGLYKSRSSTFGISTSLK